MQSKIQFSFKKKIAHLLSKGYLSHNGVRLPLLRSNEGLFSNEKYLSETISQINSLKRYSSLDEARILDFGSGQGRLLNGMMYSGVNFADYTGVDIDPVSVNWCIKNLQYNKNISFIWYNKKNERYNASGLNIECLPVRENYYDVVFSNSVFSHLNDIDVMLYSRLLYSTVREGGTLYLTAFTEEGVDDFEENPAGYLGKTSEGTPLHRVRFNKDYFVNIFINAGWELINYRQNAIARTSQSEIVFSKKAQ